MKTKINNEEFKNYGDGSIAFKMLAKGVHYVLRFSKKTVALTENETETAYVCYIFDEWCELRAEYTYKSLFGLFNQICKFFSCTIVKFQETLPIVDEALSK